MGWIRKGLVSFTVCAGAITGGAAAWPILEPTMPATRSYVRFAQNKVERTLHHIQIEQADGKKEAVDNDLFRAQLEMKKATDDQTREFIMQQINKLTETKEKIKNQINTLNAKKIE